MSASPFLPGNSIWSNNAPQTSLGTSASNNSSNLDPGAPSSTSDRNDTPRSSAHPLPSKPGPPTRANSAALPRDNGNAANDTFRSADTAFSNASLRPGVIGAARNASMTSALGQKQSDVSRSNSLAGSFQSFRSANSESPLPASLQGHSGVSQPLRSPSLHENGRGLHDRGNNVSAETDSGTPRLFLDAQHTFQNDQAPASSLGRSSRSSATAPPTSSSGKARPSSWMHPSSYDVTTESMPSVGQEASGTPFARPASSQGNHSTFSLSQVNSTLASKRASSAQFGHASIDASIKTAFDAAGAGNVGLLGHTSNPTSPGIATGSLGRNSRIDRSVAPGRATPTLAVPSYMNLSGGLLSPTAATIGSAVPSTVHSPIGSPLSGTGFHNPLPNRSVSVGHIFDKPMPPSDEVMLDSSLIRDMLDRLTRVESGMKDFSRQISGISRNVSLLLERTKGLPPASLSSGGTHTAHNATSMANGGTAEDVRALNAQVSALASSVSHLLTLQNNGLGSAGMSSGPPLTGLGLGPTGGMLGTPQLGGPNTLDRAASPRVGSHPNGQFGTGPNGPFQPSNALSPRPSGNGRGWSGSNARGQDQGADRRWNAAGQAGGSARKDNATGSNGPAGAGSLFTPGLEDNAATSASGLQQGSGLVQPNAIISKWEHLNLHPDLLRSILKYGLGPPNRIQQRSLPFLLRGSDIIAQAPPTQERIASYVIPALQLVLNVLNETGGPGQTASNRGPVALIVSTTVDQATQSQRMALGLGAPLGIRVHMVAPSGIDVHQEAQALVQLWPHIVVGTPQRMSELFTYMFNHASSLHMGGNGPAVSAIKPSEVRLVVLDEVDQLIARNLADHVSTMLRVLPLPTTSADAHPRGPGGMSPGLPQSASNDAFSPFDQGHSSLVNSPTSSTTIDRQVALFSNTVPQDVLNFAQSIHLRESVRVLVRRDGAGGGSGSAMTQAPPGGASITGGSNSAVSGMQGAASQRDMSQPTNALGAHPMNSSVSAAKDPMIAALKGMRQYYLYVAVTSNGGMGPTSSIPGLSHNPAEEMKLDLISDLLEDIDFGQTVVYCANMATQEALIYKLSSKGIEAMGLHREMNSYTRQQTLSKFRSPSSQLSGSTGYGGVSPAGRSRKALVVCDIAVNPKEVHQIPLVVFYDMPRSVEDYKDKISCAAAGTMARPSVCVNVVTASGGPRGDVEMLKTIECHFGCKMAELPMNPRQILNF